MKTVLMKLSEITQTEINNCDVHYGNYVSQLRSQQKIGESEPKKKQITARIVISREGSSKTKRSLEPTKSV
jgi:hypothetical protein